MAYILTLFDGLPIPEYIRRGDQQDISGNSAATAFLSLPGGGFFDNYGSRVSPQGVEPIHKRGILWGTHEELHEQYQAWRAKIGKRGVLTVTWDDGELRWKWARLQAATAPRPAEAKGGWLPIDLTWIATGYWRGPLQADDAWVWGDGTWVFGDGTAEFGDTGTFVWALTDTDDAVIVANEGDVDVANLVLRLEMTGSWQNVTIINETTGQGIVVTLGSPVSDSWLEIDCGARTIYSGGAQSNISSIARGTNSRVLATLVSSIGITDASLDYTVQVRATDLYDGIHYPATRGGSNTIFTFALSPRDTSYGTVATGVAQLLTDRYNVTDFSDRGRWMVLAPGNNTLRVQVNPFPTTAQFEVAYHDHYA